jgi:phage-related baseplate assembly protein
MPAERNPDYRFVSADTTEILQELTSEYERIVGITVRPASVEKLFLTWVASAIAGLRNLINQVGNQNIPSRATGANLDALGETIFNVPRPAATQARVTMRFYISEEQTAPVLIAKGTRVTPESGNPVFETVEDVYVAAGDTFVQVDAICQEAGTIGNSYEVGQINTCVDLFTYYDHCQNITTSDGGADVPDDDEYYTLLVQAQNTFSTAGAIGAYIYHAQEVSQDIQDIVVNSPDPGEVYIYAIADNAPASSGLKALILAACNEETVRPLTDHVQVEDPETVSYDINFTYYQSTESTKSATELAADINLAVNKFIEWQSAKMGRDINPSKLIQLLVEAGAKRVVVTSPTYVHLSDGRSTPVTAPEFAVVDTVTVVNGGYEDE